MVGMWDPERYSAPGEDPARRRSAGGAGVGGALLEASPKVKKSRSQSTAWMAPADSSPSADASCEKTLQVPVDPSSCRRKESFASLKDAAMALMRLGGKQLGRVEHKEVKKAESPPPLVRTIANRWRRASCPDMASEEPAPTTGDEEEKFAEDLTQGVQAPEHLPGLSLRMALMPTMGAAKMMVRRTSMQKRDREDRSVLAALSSTPLFAHSEEQVVREVCSRIVDQAPRIVIPPGDEVDLRSKPMLIVESGRLEVVVDAGSMAYAGPGSVLNTLGLLAEDDLLVESKRDAEVQRRASAVERSQLAGVSAAGSRMHSHETTAHSARQEDEDNPKPARSLTSVLGNLCPHWSPADPATEKVHVDHRPTRALRLHTAGSSRGPATVAVISQKLMEQEVAEGGLTDQYEANLQALVALYGAITRRGVFPGAPPEVLWALAEQSQWFTVEPGKEIVTEADTGDMAEAVIVLDDGTATVEKCVPAPTQGANAVRAVVASLTEGAIIGDPALVGSRVARAATVRAEMTCFAIRIPAKGIFDVLARFPGLIGCIRRRLRELAMLLKPSLPHRSQVLTGLMLFSGCSMAFMTSLASISERHVYFCGTVVKEEGSTDGTLYAVESGACRVDMEGLGTVNILGVGECFGEKMFLDWADKAVASVVVHSPIALLLAVPHNSFHSSLKRYPEEERRFACMHELPGGVCRGKHTANLEVFKACGTLFTEEMARMIEVRYYLPGQTATVEGAVDFGQMFLLKGGTAAVEVGGTQVNTLTVGAIFGEYAMLGLTRRRAATIRALTLCVTMEIHRAGFLSALDRHPGERKHFEELATQHGRRKDTKTWPIFKDMPQHLLYLVNLYAERRITLSQSWASLGGHSLDAEAAILVLQGQISIEGEDGHVFEIAEGEIINEQILMDLPPESTKLVPQNSCEVQILSGSVFNKIMENFPEQKEPVFKNILRSMASKAHRVAGFPDSPTRVLCMSPIFHATPLEIAKRLLIRMEDTTVRPGHDIITEGEIGDRIIFCVRGKYDIHMGEDVQPDAHVRRRVFGEAVLLGMSECYPLTVRSTTVTLVQTLSRPDFEEAMRNQPEEWDHCEAMRLQVAADGCHSKLGTRLMQTAFLTEAGAEFAAACCRSAEDAFFAPGDVIISRGTELSLGKSPMHVLLCGQAEVMSEYDIHMFTLTPGEAFGEWSLRPEPREHQTTIRNWKAGLSHCARLPEASLVAAVSAYPPHQNALEALLAQRQAAEEDFNRRRRTWLEDTIIPALSNSWVMASLRTEAVRKIAIWLSSRRVPAGQDIVEAGRPAESLVLLLRGEAAVLSKDGSRIGRVCGGAMIGEASVLGLLSFRTSTVRATTECFIIEVSTKSILEVLQEPGVEQTQRDFNALRDARLRQAEIGLPLSALAAVVGDECTPDIASFVRAVSLQSEHIFLPAGGEWHPIPDDCPRGPHFGVLVTGRANMVLGRDKRPVMAMQPPELVSEGLASKFGAVVAALSPCDAFRIWQSDLLSVAKTVPSCMKLLARFDALWKPIQDKSKQRLENACGPAKQAVGARRRLAAWREAESLKRGRRDELLSMCPSKESRSRLHGSQSLPQIRIADPREVSHMHIHTTSGIHSMLQGSQATKSQALTPARNIQRRYQQAHSTARAISSLHLKPQRSLSAVGDRRSGTAIQLFPPEDLENRPRTAPCPEGGRGARSPWRHSTGLAEPRTPADVHSAVVVPCWATKRRSFFRRVGERSVPVQFRFLWISFVPKT